MAKGEEGGGGLPMGLHVDILQKLVCEVHFAGTSPKKISWVEGGWRVGETCPSVHFCGEFCIFFAQKISPNKAPVPSLTPIQTRQRRRVNRH